MFSDILLYAKMNWLGKYNPHLIVPLEACGLVEVDSSVEKNGLIVAVAERREA